MSANGLRQALTAADDSVITRITMAAGEYEISESLPSINSTVQISGSGNVEVSAAPGYLGSFLSAGSLSTLTLDNVHVRGFRRSAIRTEADGDTKITNCIFENNSDSSGGGAISAGNDLDDFFTVLIIENCIFLGNSSMGAGTHDGGGAVHMEIGKLEVSDSQFQNNASANVGGAVYIRDGLAGITNSSFDGNTSDENGGAIHVDEGISLKISNSSFRNNIGDDGGAVSGNYDSATIEDNQFEDNGRIVGGAIKVSVDGKSIIRRNLFKNNFSIIQEGTHIALNLDQPDSTGLILGNVFVNLPNSVNDQLIRARGRGRYKIAENSAVFPRDRIFLSYDFFNKTLADGAQLHGNAVGGPAPTQNRQAGNTSALARGTACLSRSPIDGDPFSSAGYNIFGDDSCPSDGPSDISNADPVFDETTEAGLTPLAPGSPAIDTGASDVFVYAGDTLASLPCDYVDLAGVARPQDANGDGVFECDRGAMEVPGTGEIVAAHSAGFFNTARSGEGTYVEILDDNLAVVYTFTYTPDGTAPAWMLAVADVVGNSIISRDMIITSGTRFGSNFKASDVVISDWGDMSMVFSTCEANPDPGNVAYTGSEEFGYEALITKATRLSRISLCDGSAVANAGLSGSFFNTGRAGEGIIVEWLVDGPVLVVFFTYGVNGGQMWLFGTGTPSGNSVTVNAFYPTGLSRWGRGFDTNDVVVSPWGTLTLDYSDCNNLTFSYNSTVAGFGSGSHAYTRLSKLKGFDCPM